MKYLILTICLTLTSSLFSQENTFLTIDNNKYDVSEFNYIYTKNNKNASYNSDSLLSYVNKYFIDYKLKIIEAKHLGYDTIPKLINELKQYRNQLSRPYLIDKKKNEALIEEAYDRTINEIRASHILITVKPNANSVDTLKAYNRVIALRKRVLEGEDFEKVAASPGGSQDPSARTNGGDLGYFTALQMVYPFEDAAFKTKVGEVSMPVRTQFGYHIIKVTDKRKSKGKIQVAHIMIMTDKTKPSTKQNEEKINEIYTLLKNGEAFKDLAQKYSDDQSSKAKGGILPEFGAGSKQRMVPEFETASFNLKNNGDYSEPFKTAYGWHIVKRINTSPVPEYEKMRRELKLKVEKDVRSQTTQQSFINTLKKEYNYKENAKILSNLAEVITPEVFSGNWKNIKQSSGKDELISFANQSFSVDDFLQHIKNTQRKEKPQSMNNYLDYKFKTWSNRLVLNYENKQLEGKYPEFKNLMREYEEGVLIFEIMQDQIWTKASQDTIGLKNYYEAHKSEFTYPARYKGTLYKCKDKKTAKKAIKMLKSKALTNNEIQDSLNQESKLNLSFKKATFNTNNEAFAKKKAGKFRKFKAGKQKFFKCDGNYYVFKNDAFLEPSVRQFNEAKGLATAGYQNELQKNWIKGLRAKSKIKINNDILFKAESFK